MAQNNNLITPERKKEEKEGKKEGKLMFLHYENVWRSMSALLALGEKFITAKHHSLTDLAAYNRYVKASRTPVTERVDAPLKLLFFPPPASVVSVISDVSRGS